MLTLSADWDPGDNRHFLSVWTSGREKHHITVSSKEAQVR